MSPGPALPRPLRPRRLSLCCLSLLSLCRLSLLSLFFPRSQIQSWFPAWFTVLPQSGGLQSRLLRPGGLQSRLLRPGGLQSCLLRLGGLQSRLLRPGGLQSRLLRLGGLQVRLLHPGGPSPVCSALVGSRSVCSTLGGPSPVCSAQVGSRSVCSPWRAPVPSSPPWLPHGPGPPSLPLFRLRSTAHHGLFRSVWKPLLGGGYVTNPGHELCFTPHSQSQITQGLHFPSSTAPTQLSALITHTPANNHPITITQSHTHTHYISPGHSPIHCRVLLASLPTKRFP